MRYSGRMGAITDLFKSERGLLAVAVIVAATVLCGTHQLTVDQWTTFTEWIFATYVAGKTITGATATLAESSASKPRNDHILADIMASAAELWGRSKDQPADGGTQRTQTDPQQAPPSAAGTPAPSTVTIPTIIPPGAKA